MMKSHDVFVSYSSKDKIVADAVVASLEKESIRCWYAPRDIKPGTDWGEEIVKAVTASKVFLLIFSKNSNSSQRVLDELNVAISNELVIIPFRIEKLDPSGAMLLHLSSRHWLDAFVPSWEKHIDDLVKSVSLNLEKTDLPIETNFAKSSAKPFASKKRKTWIIAIIAAVIALSAFTVFGLSWLSQQARNPSTDQVPSQTVPLPTYTPSATETPTQQGPALGSASNPIIWMYVPPVDLDFQDANALTSQIVNQFGDENPGLTLKAIPAADNVSIVEALCDGEAHIGSLQSISYLIVSQRECAEAKLIWNAHGDIKYGGMIVTKNTSTITSLSDLQGKSLCIPGNTSMSGWVLPSLEIKALGGDLNTFLGQIIDSGNHLSVLQGVYNGECDAGSTFYNALELINDPGINENLRIVFTTLPVPGQNMSFGNEINSDLSDILVNYFLNSSSGSTALAQIAGTYNPESPAELIEINDYYYHGIRDLFDRAGADPEEYIYTGN
jgi:phosphonate transport system substrate-binding protein